MTDRYCDNCGHELDPDSRFCASCGRSLGETAAPASESETSGPERISGSVSGLGIPPDIERAMTDLETYIGELDKVMMEHGIEGVIEAFEEPRQTVREYIINNLSDNELQSQSSRVELGQGRSGFFFLGGVTSEAEEDEDRGGWLGNLFG